MKMKANLYENGNLVIFAENGLEAFALKAWERARKSGKGTATLEFDYSEFKAWEGINEFNETFSKAPGRLKKFKKWEEDQANAGTLDSETK